MYVYLLNSQYKPVRSLSFSVCSRIYHQIHLPVSLYEDISLLAYIYIYSAWIEMPGIHIVELRRGRVLLFCWYSKPLEKFISLCARIQCCVCVAKRNTTYKPYIYKKKNTEKKLYLRRQRKWTKRF